MSEPVGGSIPADLAAGRTGFAGVVARAVTLWALAGGLLLLAVVVVNCLAVLGMTVGRSFPGDFELTEMGVAMAVFAFLPWCQLTGANVTADIFTARAGPRVLAGLGALASAVACAFALLLLWRMSLGLLDQRAYGYTTTILQIPVWWGFLPALASLALLALAALVTLGEALASLRRRA